MNKENKDTVFFEKRSILRKFWWNIRSSEIQCNLKNVVQKFLKLIIFHLILFIVHIMCTKAICNQGERYPVWIKFCARGSYKRHVLVCIQKMIYEKSDLKTQFNFYSSHCRPLVRGSEHDKILCTRRDKPIRHFFLTPQPPVFKSSMKWYEMTVRDFSPG